jgi:hypothetical protein
MILPLLASDAVNFPGAGLGRPQPAHLGLKALMFKHRVLDPSANVGYAKIQRVARQGSNWDITVEIMHKVINIQATPDLRILNATVVSILPKK